MQHTTRTQSTRLRDRIKNRLLHPQRVVRGAVSSEFSDARQAFEARFPAGITSADVFGKAGFAHAFAVFLLQRPDAWRMRRVDRFSPLDVELAEHHLTLQGVIKPALLRRFFEIDGAVLGLEDFEVRNGDELTLFVPVFLPPKRLLLDFQVSRNRDEVELLTRGESAVIGGLYLLDRVVAAHTSDVDQDEARRLHVVLASLVFQDPSSLEARLKEWASDKGRVFNQDLPLKSWDLKEWVREEGEKFHTGLGSGLCQTLSEVIERSEDREWGLSLDVPRGRAISHFPTLESLLMHNIRDLLKVMVEQSPPWRDPNTPPDLHTRNELIDDPSLLCSVVKEEVIPSLETLRETLRKDDGARAVLVSWLTRWTAFVATKIRVGVPFTISASQTLPLDPELSSRGRIRRFLELQKAGFYRVSHTYPLTLRDAASAHVEVVIPDTEIRFAPVTPFLGRNISLVYRDHGEEAHESLSFAFGSELKASERLLHLYTSRRRDEGPYQARQGMLPYERSLRVPLMLFVPLKLARQILVGYTAAVLVVLGAAGYIASAVAREYAGVHNIPDSGRVFAIGALVVTVSLWLANVPARRPLVNRMLVPFHWGFYVAVLVILVALSALAIDWVAERTFPEVRLIAAAAVVTLTATVSVAWRKRRLHF